MSARGEGGASTCRWRTLVPPAEAGELAREEFARDVLLGLSGAPKSLPSRHFYDEAGSRIFQRIMDLPEYYLTDCELEILVEQRDRIAALVGDAPFNLVELGAGDGQKTQVLLRRFLELGLDFRYVPIDICEPAVAGLAARCEEHLPGLDVEGIVSEYCDGLSWLSGVNDRRSVVLFLGSNIGNFRPDEAQAFLRRLRAALNGGDLALVGFDLRKDPDILTRAYSDPGGVTAGFNLNLLERINRELGGRFRPGRFAHYATYNVRTGAMESYLLSRAAQTVAVEALGRSFSFAAWEPIHTEVSQKFLPGEIPALAAAGGFETLAELRDGRDWFLDAVWRVRT